MKYRTLIPIVIVSSVLTQTAYDSDKPGPSANSDAVSESNSTDDQTFRTTLGYEITPLQDFPLSEAEWPELKDPVDLNDTFYRPSKVWRIEGGFLGVYNMGEFGGGLFFGTSGSRKWKRILARHISEVVCLGPKGDVLVASGGLSHISGTDGHVFLINRRTDGRFSTRQVFSSAVSIPSIIGTCTEKSPESRHLTVFTLSDPFGSDPEKVQSSGIYLGVDASGVIYYLGEHNSKAGSPAAQDSAE